MEIKPLSKFTKEDLAKYRGLRSIISSGKYDLKGDAINTVASLLAWYESLGGRIEYMIKSSDKKKKKPVPEVKELSK